MSSVARSRLHFLVSWLALEATLRANAARRLLPSVVNLLDQARATQQMLQPWLEALLTRRHTLRGTLAPAFWHRRLAGLVQADACLEPFSLAELRSWSVNQLFWLLVEELVRLVRLCEAPCAMIQRPGWDRWDDHWEAARWALVVCLVRVNQLERALDAQLTAYPAQAGLREALRAAWQRLTIGQGQAS
jgi:hypothetical protein